MTFEDAAAHLVEIGRNFHQRGWVLGTSGNLSIVLGRDPLSLAITASSLDKGKLTPQQILRVNANGKSTEGGTLRPSAETLLHTTIAQRTSAAAIFHTHSVWSTVLSDYHRGNSGFFIEGYEMLKGLSGVQTHEHREWLPIIENSQDMEALAKKAGALWENGSQPHGFLIRRHGLYTWGSNLEEAVRHVEIFEFLLESFGRRQMMEPQL
jgi:methylthioribulose-1-phosphate dehydratase